MTIVTNSIYAARRARFAVTLGADGIAIIPTSPERLFVPF
jgi:hypothetical protein